MKRERIGLFGGTFNPIHLGHLRAAEIVQQKFDLDKVLFIPSYIPPHKESDEIASPFHRLRMVELACDSYPGFFPSYVEIEAKGTSYSIITLNKIRELFPEALIFFILGIDSFLEIETWKDYKKLINQCFFIVVSRPGYHLNEAREVFKGRYRDRIYEFTEPRRKDEEIFSSFRIFILPIDALNIASSDIRRKIREGNSVEGFVPETVEAYIREHKIYHKGNA